MKRNLKVRPFLQSFVLITAVVVLSVISVHWWGEKPEKPPVTEILISSDLQTAADIAQANQIHLSPVLKALGLNESQAATATIADVGLTAQQAQIAIKKALVKYNEEMSKNWYKIFAKFLLWFLLLPIPFVLLLRKKITPGRRRLLLLVGVVVFGVALGADPSPMGTVKDAVFLLAAHGTVFGPRLVALVVFLLTVVLANKFICSWGCQFGTLQDLVFRLARNRPDRKGIFRQYKPPFWLSNTVRIAVFAAFTLVGLLWAFDFIGVIDPFKIFSPAAMTGVGIVFVAMVLIASLFVWRPWCHFACPFGLVSWFFEKLAIFRIKVDYSKCTACQACQAACPSDVMEAILNQNRTIPDCFSCGNCLEACPTDAVSFTARRDPVFDLKALRNRAIRQQLYDYAVRRQAAKPLAVKNDQRLA